MRGSVSEAASNADPLAQERSVDAQRQIGASMEGTVVIVEREHVMLQAWDGGSLFKLSLADVINARA